MPSRRDPYAQFNFRLSLGTTVIGGFQEVSGITKLKGLNKSTDVTLKRGVIGATAFRDWLKQVRKRRVSIELQSESGAVAGRWILTGAKPIKYTAGAMNAKGTDVDVEELVLSCRRLEIGINLAA